jgi:hypothetical protein
MSHKDKDKASDASASEASNSDESSSDSSSKKSKHKEKKVKTKSKDKKKDKKDKKKDKKSSKKSSKPGPRGAQWLNWKIPYQEGSALGQSFNLAAKKGGIDNKKLEKAIKKMKATPSFIISRLKKGHSKGFKWDVDDSHGRLRITGCKIVDKKWSK